MLPTVALVVAVVALLIALAAWARAGSGSSRVADVERDSQRRVANAGDELRRELETLKELLAVVASGGRLTRDQVLEGRLWSDVSPQDGLRMVQQGEVRLVDVRTRGETAGGIIPGALLIPVDELQARMGELPKDGRRTLIYCAAGSRSAAACEFLSQQGYANLANLEGGFGAWQGPRARP